MEVEKLKNIISTERLKCVFRISIDVGIYEYVTVSLPSETEENMHRTSF